jgi:hypothetical protein
MEDIKVNKKTTWWIALIFVGVTMLMVGGFWSGSMIEASQAENDLFSILSGRFCGRVCLEAEEEAVDPVPEPPPPPIISNRSCGRGCLEADVAPSDPVPEPPPPPIIS